MASAVVPRRNAWQRDRITPGWRRRRAPSHRRQGLRPNRSRGPTAPGAGRTRRLDATTPAARARDALGVDDDVPDVAGVPGPPVVGGAVEYQPTADAGGDHHAEQEVRATACAVPPLAECHAQAVAAEPDRTTGDGGHPSTIGKRCHSVMLIGLTVPLGRSMGPAEEMPTPVTSPPAFSSASPINASATAHTVSASPSGVGCCARCTRVPSASTRPAAIFVPPTSRTRVVRRARGERAG